MTEISKKQLFPVSAILVLVSLILPMIIWGNILETDKESGEFNYYFWDVISIIAYQLTAGVLMLIWVKFYKVDVMDMWQKFDSKFLSNGFQLTLIQFLFSITSAFVLFYMLSLYFPDYAIDALKNTPQFLHYIDGKLNFTINFLYFISVVILAPIVEEFVFRGLLLRRLSEKWSTKSAVVVSSLIFAIFHGDPIGAFLLALVMCYVYFLCGSLWLPIICHALNNFIVWSLSITFMIVDGPDQEQDIEIFIDTIGDDLYVGLIAGMVGIIWAVIYFKKNPVKITA